MKQWRTTITTTLTTPTTSTAIATTPADHISAVLLILFAVKLRVDSLSIPRSISHHGRVLNASQVGAFYAGVIDTFKHIAFLMRGDTVLAVGTNHMKIAKGGAHNHGCKLSQRHQLHSVESVHAEADAIRRWRDTTYVKSRSTHSRARITMYVIRVTNSGKFRNSRPCESCSGAIMAEKKIKTVIYSTNDGFEEVKASKLLD